MNGRITESERKVVMIVLNTKLFYPEILSPKDYSRYYWRQHHSDYFNLVCLNRKKRRYGFAYNGKVVDDFSIPETFFQVMDDIENGKILQSDVDPNLRFEYIKSYGAYKS